MNKLFLLALLLPTLAHGAPKVTGKPSLPTYETQYYVINTDLPPQMIREADLRMTRMVETYLNRTEDFSGAIRQKLPFYLYAREEDYLAAGGMEGSAGMFDNSSQQLMAVAGEEFTPATWHVIQHEGFHQFAHAVIGGEPPLWVNEGLAEYFGEGIFTGDGFVTGVIPDWRAKRIKQEIVEKKLRTVREMMDLEHGQWNSQMSIENYDQAWSMVQFLAHADKGKYQRPFVGFMQDIAHNEQWPKAWEDNFGSAEGFEAKWKKYWIELAPNATEDLFAKAAVQTLAGVLGRAASQHQFFQSIAQLDQAIESNSAKFNREDWLPPSVIEQAQNLRNQLEKTGAKFTLAPAAAGRLATIVCQLKNGRKITGRYTTKGPRIGTVVADIPGGTSR